MSTRTHSAVAILHRKSTTIGSAVKLAGRLCEAPTSRYRASASLILLEHRADRRVGGQHASSVFHAARPPACRLGRRRGAEIEQRQRRCGARPSPAAPAPPPPRATARARLSGGHMRLGPVGELRGAERGDRVGPGIGLDGACRSRPAPCARWPAAARRRGPGGCPHAQPRGPRPCRGSPAGARRASGPASPPAGPRAAGIVVLAGRPAARATRCISARSAGSQGAWGGGASLSSARQRSSAARASPLCASCRPR